MSDDLTLPSGDPLLAIVLRAREGRAGCGAIDELDRALRPRLKRYFSGTAACGEDPDDLVQKTMLAVFKHVERLEDPRRFLGWLFAIARNVSHTAREEKLRRDRVEVSGLEVGGAGRPEPAVHPEEAWKREEAERRLEAVRAAIQRLPVRQRQCLMLQLRDEMSYEEIARTLRLSANTVRNHLAQARETLRRDLSGQDEGCEP